VERRVTRQQGKDKVKYYDSTRSGGSSTAREGGDGWDGLVGSGSSGEDDVSFFGFSLKSHLFMFLVESTLVHDLLKTHLFIFYKHNKYVYIYYVCTYLNLCTYVNNIG